MASAVGRQHGSGQACAKARVTPRCEECREYSGQRKRKDVLTPGSYRYQQVHGQGRAGAIHQMTKRRSNRRIAEAKDIELLEEA